MSTEHKRVYDRERQQRIWAAGEHWQQQDPARKRTYDLDRNFQRAGSLERILSDTASHRRETEAALAALKEVLS